MESYNRGLPEVLSVLAAHLADLGGLEDTCKALYSGRLTQTSTSVVRYAIANGRSGLEKLLSSLQGYWQSMEFELSGAAFALLLQTSAAAIEVCRRSLPQAQMVWTGPNVDGSYPRATKQVVREIIRTARSEILVVGYWIAARSDGEGIIEELIESLANAVERKVSVVVIVDQRPRRNGQSNLQIIRSVWPAGVALPRLLTWRLPEDDAHLKLHAKVIVADQRDALITSANLTSYAMDRNIEMGVRVSGVPAREVALHYMRLAQSGVLEPYSEEWT